MAKVEIPYVKVFKDRHNKVRCYYRRKGYRQVPLPGLPGDPDFMAAYRAAEANASLNAKTQREPARSFGSLLARYYQSAAFISLKPQTQKNYRNILERFRTIHGSKSCVTINAIHLNSIFNKMVAKPGALRNLRKRLASVFAYAVEIGWRKDNPVRDTTLKLKKSNGHIPWSEADIQAFEARWPSGTRERRALCLLLYTGLRRSDVVKLGHQHVSNDAISVVQKKTGERVSIPILPELRAEIEHAEDMIFILTQYGRPFSEAGFTAWFVERAKQAGLSKRTPHGLRKACGRRLANAGCTSKQIAAVLGQSSLSQITTYTKDADQALLARSAMDRLRG